MRCSIDNRHFLLKCLSCLLYQIFGDCKVWNGGMVFWLEPAENQMNPSSPVENWLVFALFCFRARYFIGFIDLICLSLFLGQFFLSFFMTHFGIFQIQVIFPRSFPWLILEYFNFRSFFHTIFRDLFWNISISGHFSILFFLTYFRAMQNQVIKQLIFRAAPESNSYWQMSFYKYKLIHDMRTQSQNNKHNHYNEFSKWRTQNASTKSLCESCINSSTNKRIKQWAKINSTI